MKSLLFQEGATVHTVPPGCGLGERQEVTVAFRKNGRIYRTVIRDKVQVEDPYIVMVKAATFAIRSGEPYNGQGASRTLKDFLIKLEAVI